MTMIIPITTADIAYARLRPPAERTAPPRVDERLLYRHTEWDTDLLDAVVLAVQDPREPCELFGDPRVDGNMWRLSDRAGAVHLPEGLAPDDLPAGWLEPHPDPWPLVRLLVPALSLAVDCREARVRGSAGWLRAG